MRSQAKAGASVPRTGKLCPGEAGSSPIFLGGKALQGVGAGRQDGGDALGLPGTLTDTCAPRRLHHTPRLSSLKDCRAHG